jgi:hypothetical protein
MTAPLTIGNDLAKKALLIVAVNAGLPNDKTRLPRRIRSHAGLTLPLDPDLLCKIGIV